VAIAHHGRIHSGVRDEPGRHTDFTPFSYLIVNNLKRAEREDYFDRHTDFTPFSLRD
jgi:hypothetical protein